LNAPEFNGGATRRFSLPTGELELTVHASRYTPDSLLGFAARANAKRGFLFLSKVLGKHWPVTPSRMAQIHASLAAGIPEPAGPVVFIAMAETAIGLGQGVFEAWLANNPGREALFLHSTRYRVGAGPLIEFEEAHSHAPRQFLHLPDGGTLQRAANLVLIDDEASTGNTFYNLVQACRRLQPGLAGVHLAVITDFMGANGAAALARRLELPVTLDACLHGAYRFTPGALPDTGVPGQRYDPHAERGASAGFGRLGLARALTLPAGLARKLADGVGSGERVLVLGTGEFMHAAYRLGAALEQCGLAVAVQSTTRSPILQWGAVSHVLPLADNYGEGIANFLYNVVPGQYQQVFICHETPPNAALFHLARVLRARLLHFISEDHVDDIAEIPVC